VESISFGCNRVLSIDLTVNHITSHSICCFDNQTTAKAPLEKETETEKKREEEAKKTSRKNNKEAISKLLSKEKVHQNHLPILLIISYWAERRFLMHFSLLNNLLIASCYSFCLSSLLLLLSSSLSLSLSPAVLLQLFDCQSNKSSDW